MTVVRMLRQPLDPPRTMNLSGQSDSEDEDYFDSSQQLETVQNASDSFTDHLPSNLQGLSIAEIARSKWYAEAFLVGKCATSTIVYL